MDVSFSEEAGLQDGQWEVSSVLSVPATGWLAAASLGHMPHHENPLADCRHLGLLPLPPLLPLPDCSSLAFTGGERVFIPASSSLLPPLENV